MDPLNLEIPNELLKVFTDQQQIAWVLGNLVMKAYRIIPEGGDLSIHVRECGKSLAVADQDAGAGSYLRISASLLIRSLIPNRAISVFDRW